VPIEPLALERVVRATEKLDVLDGGLATDPVRLVVVELHERSLVAPPSALAHEGTPAVVAPPNAAPHFRGNVPAARSRTTTGARAIRRRVLLPAEFFDQEPERALDDLRGIAVGNRVPEQVLGLTWVLPCLCAHRDSNLVTLRGQRCHDRTPRRRG